MRNLHRNMREMYYAPIIGTESVLDAYGNDTLEVKPTYGAPTQLLCNVSANVGQDAVQVFGQLTNYSRTVSIASEKCPLSEGAKVWFGASIAGPNNYVVVKVADSKNGYLIALREVTLRG